MYIIRCTSCQSKIQPLIRKIKGERVAEKFKAAGHTKYLQYKVMQPTVYGYKLFSD